MRNLCRAIAMPIAILVLATAALAQSPVGNWKGKIKVDRSKMPQQGSLTPEQKKMVDAQLKQLESITITLNLKADKTFTASGPAGKGKTSTSTGKWSQSGDKITLTNEKSDGKPATGQMKRPQVFILKDGKLTMTQQGMTVVFTKK